MSLSIKKYSEIKNVLQRLEEKFYFEDADEIMNIDFSICFKGKNFFYCLFNEENYDVAIELINNAETREELEGDRMFFIVIDGCELLIFDCLEFLFIFTDEFNKKEFEILIEQLC